MRAAHECDDGLFRRTDEREGPAREGTDSPQARSLLMTAGEKSTARPWPNLMVIGIGFVCSWLVMFYGMPVPKTWLFTLDSLVFWLLVAASLLIACAPVVGRFLPVVRKSGLSPAGFCIFRHWCGPVSLDALGLVGALIVFSLPLSSLWFTGRTTYLHVGGLLPWSDPSNYYFGARHLLNEGYLDIWNMRRPLNAGFFATRLWLVNQDFQLALVLQAWVAALACFLAARELARSHGAAGGVMMFALLYEFMRPHLGIAMSEGLGLSFGCLGFVLLWAACEHTRPWPLVALGMMFLTLGLNARSGAFFVLPALLLWALWAFRAGGSFGWQPAGWGLVGLCAGFFLNALLLWAFGSDTNMLHSIFAYHLYGLALGGKSWLQIYVDHPEVKTMLDQNGEGAVAKYIYGLAFQEFLNNPKLFFLAYWDGLKLYWHNVFFFVEETGYYETGLYGHEQALSDVKLVRVFQILSFFPLGFLLLRARDHRLLQLGFVVVAIFASAPLLLRNGGYRLFAATLPYVAAMPAVGVSFLASVLGRHRSPAGSSAPAGGTPERASPSPQTAVVVGSLLTFSTVIGPMLAVAFHDRPQFDQLACEQGLSPVIFKLGSGSAFLKILPEGSSVPTRVPEIRYEDFRADRTFGRIEIASVFKKVRPRAWIVHAYDVRPGLKEYQRQVWLLADEAVSLPPPGSYVQVCGQMDGAVREYRVLYVKSAEVVEPLR